MLDALEANLRRRVIVYSDIAELFLFLANLKATELEIVQGVKFLEEACPKDVDPKLTDELLYFHLYVRQAQNQGLTEEQSIFLSHGDLYQIMCKEKIHTAFPYVEALFRLFLCLIVTNCSGENLSQGSKASKRTEINIVSRKVVCTEHSVH